jgi:mono/diheme cytochrome c family protein
VKTRGLVCASLLLAVEIGCGPGIVFAQQTTGQETKLVSAMKPTPAASATTTAAAAAAAPARAAAARQEDEDALRLEGEKRFRANCGRCHQAPHKLSPRMMATAVRHMRVRATITDEDMRVILHYMTQ